MAIAIKETFVVQAPIERVWQFVMDPEMVVTCMPGAELVEVVDETTFLGKVSIKVGAITTSYSGKVTFTLVD
ncbi:MAG: carbon monoxide dehydrogenase, partial [Chloroflexi bacterium]|nr:carbon monoxide dehydrogenase [Chloroflexota bacterium]